MEIAKVRIFSKIIWVSYRNHKKLFENDLKNDQAWVIKTPYQF